MVNLICYIRRVQIKNQFSGAMSILRFDFRLSLRGAKRRSNPVARDCFAPLAMTLIGTAMLLYQKIKLKLNGYFLLWKKVYMVFIYSG